jgi:hypothetical protein
MDVCWDGSSRSGFDCSCPPQSHCEYSCEPGYYYDSTYHSCNLDRPETCENVRECKTGEFFDYTSCKCEELCELKCNEPMEWADYNKCQCVFIGEGCDIIELCKPGYYFDTNYCGCVEGWEMGCDYIMMC